MLCPKLFFSKLFHLKVFDLNTFVSQKEIHFKMLCIANCINAVSGASSSSDEESSYQSNSNSYSQSQSSAYQQNSCVPSTASYMGSSNVSSSSRKTKNVPVVYTDGGCFANGRRKASAGIGVYWGDGDKR